MKAVAVYPGKPNSVHLEEMPKPSVHDVSQGKGVLVRVLKVGVDATDREINEALNSEIVEGTEAHYVSLTDTPLDEIARRAGKSESRRRVAAGGAGVGETRLILACEMQDFCSLETPLRGALRGAKELLTLSVMRPAAPSIIAA